MGVPGLIGRSRTLPTAGSEIIIKPGCSSDRGDHPEPRKLGTNSSEERMADFRTGEELIDAVEEQLVSLLTSFESSSNTESTPSNLSTLDPELRSQVQKTRDCLQLLRRIWSKCENATRESSDRGDHAPAPAISGAIAGNMPGLPGTISAGTEEGSADSAEPREPGTDLAVKEPRKFGRFTILEELGEGGYGIVYLAYDPVLERRVALKLPRLETLASSQRRRRFLVEVRAAARLDHPNIVPIHEIGELGLLASSGLYIAMAYCEEGNLATWVERQDAPIAPRPAAQLMLYLAAGVQHVHDQGILHRDLKPSNVLLERSTRSPHRAGPASTTDTKPTEQRTVSLEFIPRVSDFGLARFLDGAGEATLSGMPLGSPQYMSPEQAQGDLSAMGPATDVYGLGAIFYTILTLRPPFRGETVADTIQRVIQDDPIPPRRICAAVPRDLETICLKCLQKKPPRRYESARALGEDLERFLAGEPIQARRPFRLGGGWLPVRTSR